MNYTALPALLFFVHFFQVPVDVLTPDSSTPTQDRLRYTMPESYGSNWKMTLKIIKGTGAQTYSPWPGTGAAINFGYQPPEILHTDTTNTAPSNVLIELIGTNFGVDQSVATVYICQSGTVNPDQLCFAAGDPKNGPHAASIPMVETDVSVWDHTTIRIQPQNNRTFNKKLF